MPTIRDLARARVVVVGDAMVDVWVHGRVDRISPEAPVPVFVEERRETRAGGAGNVVENLRALGCTVGYPYTVKGATKTRYVVNHQQIFRSDLEDCLAIDDETQQRSFERATQEPCDVMILSDYAKGALPASLCQRLIAWATQRGVKVVVDPKGADWTKYKGADVITPNEAEFQAYGGRNSLLGFNTILVTQGARGMWLSSYGAKDVSIPAANKGPVDVCGAGDTVIAVLAAAIAVGFDLEQAARLANAAAGVTVGKFGTATCSLDELEAAMGTQTKRPVIGFCNGVFDRFHDGHIHFLRECLMNCDVLHVAINGPVSARISKGAVQAMATRASSMIYLLRECDRTHDFESEQDLQTLMQHIKPDVIFKGEDYHGKPVTGGDLARIHWVARHPGYSSTIERAKAKA